MARPTDTRTLVREIAQELLAAGTKPTQAQIRALIEKRAGVRASPNVVADELDAFWSAFGAQMIDRYRAPGVPAVLTESFARLWQEALASAHAAFEADRRRAETDAQAARLEGQAVKDSLGAENDLLRTDLTLASQQAALREAALAATQAELRQTSESLDVARRDVERLAEQIEATRAERAAERADFLARLDALDASRREAAAQAEAQRRAEVAALAEQHKREADAWDGMRRHLMMETSRIRDAQKAELDAVKGRLQDYELRLETFTQRLNAEQSAHAKTRGLLEAAQVEVDRMRNESEARLREIGRLQGSTASRVRGSDLGGTAA